jgi:hypothetical protein
VELRRVEKKLNSVREAGVRLDSINAIFGATVKIGLKVPRMIRLKIPRTNGQNAGRITPFWWLKRGQAGR